VFGGTVQHFPEGVTAARQWVILNSRDDMPWRKGASMRRGGKVTARWRCQILTKFEDKDA
jgi:hypothetical protein